PHKELSVNSFHYNHILPMASMLLDYMITDVYAKSEGAVNFPSEYIEGYAYLQNKFYGHAPGTFYGETGVNLWMPKGLLAVDNVELNYVSGYRDNDLYIAFTNQSDETVATRFSIDSERVELADQYIVTQWHENKPGDTRTQSGDEFAVQVAANGITVVKISGARVHPSFRHQFGKESNSVANDYLESDVGNARAMLIKLGDYDLRAYIYLRDDDSIVESATLRYQGADGAQVVVTDTEFPFEWTIDFESKQTDVTFSLEVNNREGETQTTGQLSLGQ